MKHGYCLTAGSKMYFMPTDKTRKTKAVVCEMIDKVGQYRGLCAEMVERCKSDKECFSRIQYDMDLCTLELKNTGKVEYYSIVGSNFIMSIPLADADCLVIF